MNSRIQSKLARHLNYRAGNDMLIEPLEDRLFLSAAALPQGAQALRRLERNAGQIAKPIAIVQSVSHESTSPSSSAITPAEMDAAYGISGITFGSVAGNGAGETIAIVDAYDDPDAASDLHNFDLVYGLPDAPSFQRFNQNGVAGSYPTVDPAEGSGDTWEVEESLDIEWAHVVAPDASIDLVEASSASMNNLVSAAVNSARDLPGVVAVSMSFSSSENSSDSGYNSLFTTPLGHPGVTFLAATGDTGHPGGYPAYSPNVVAVGGTTLSLDGSTYAGESGWSGSGGGISVLESQPAFQKGVVTQSSTARTIPDVSIDADPNSGVAVYDSFDFGKSPWIEVGGTSLATPMWAGLVAIADQGRALASLPSLDGATQTLPALYKLPAADFNDVTIGNNGFAAGTGYDLVTGIGSPVANLLIPALAGVQSISGTVFQDNNGDGVLDGNDTPLVGDTVYLDANNNTVLDPTITTPFTSTNVPLTFKGNSTTNSTLAVSGTTAPTTNISVTFNITETHDSNLTAYLIGPDGTTVTLFSNVVSTGANFTGTTISSQGTTSIAPGSAPFTGTFAPSPGNLVAFNGKSANGTWTLRIVDAARSDSATLVNWSMALTTGEISTATNSQGQYEFNSVPVGAYTLRQIVPLNEMQLDPVSGADVGTTTVPAVTGENFADFPTLLNDTTDSDTLYLVLDSAGENLQIFNTASPIGTPEYQIALAALPTLAIKFSGANQTLDVDYTNGNPIPADGLIFTGDSAATDTLAVIGGSSTNLALTDTQIAPVAGGPAIAFTNLGTFAAADATIEYTGDFSSFNNLDLEGATTFIFE